ncbi:histidine kinase, partial [Hamadaea sp. NPDC051192]|uniref:sensor histidine kinase n=1 Tax=Hamadaea sp. NPDC051192 TaxID=3154940 RepID=UPI00343AFCEB
TRLLGAYAVVAVGLLPTGLGYLLLPSAASGLRRWSDRARGWVRSETGEPLAPARPSPGGRSAADPASRRPMWTTRLILGEAGFWRDLRWAILDPLAGGLLLAIPNAFLLYGVFGALVQPLLWRRLGGGNWYAFIPVTSTTTMLLAALLGVGFAVLGAVLATPVLRLHARWTRLLLTPGRVELTRRVRQLAGSRAEVLDVHAAEVRRIERDLHDGAQARLVALGMTLDVATRLVESDPTRARLLLLEVRENSERALQELRDLVRGILPPVLADRGLPDAVRSLALESPLDVHVESTVAGRPPAPVESAAYFAVAELLANAGKHAGARTVTIRFGHDGTRLRAEVADDGRGGADPGGGSGLRGILGRLAAFDGTLALHSPPGGPTTATLEIPCALSSPKTSSFSATGSPGR